MSSAANPNTVPVNAHPVVLQVLPLLETGEIERNAVDVAVFLKRAGGTPIVVSEGGRLVHELERNGILHITLPIRSESFLTIRANSRALAQLIRQHGVDIVHARSRAGAWSAFFAARRTGAAFLTTHHQAYPFSSGLRKLYNSVMARGDRVIAISNFIADHLGATYGTNPSRIRTIPRGIDLYKFNPDTVTAERMASLTHEWRLNDGQKVILCPSRLDHGKGQSVLLKALASLPRRDFACILTGNVQSNPTYCAELEEEAIRLGLEGHVKMVGECTDMPTALMLADVVVAPSIVPEGFGRVAVEAQAMGRPVVASRLGGMKESVLVGETGWLIEAGHPDQLAEALDLALTLTPEQRTRLAARAVSHAQATYSRDNMCWLTLDVYQELYDGQVPWALSATAG
jgi:glycosyltransferase involved in cell wall biosynthesis